MILDHVRVFTEDKKFTDGGIVIKDGRIAEVYTEGNCPAADGAGDEAAGSAGGGGQDRPQLA